MPRTEAQIKAIITKNVSQNIVFYDSPERILKTLAIIGKYRKNAKIALGRELSKMFEEVVIDKAQDVLNHFKEGIKGEIVCMLYSEKNSSIAEIEQKASILKNKGFKNKEISVILSELFDYNKNDIYKIVLSLDK